MSKATPQNFSGINPWKAGDYIDLIAEEAEIDSSVLYCEAFLNHLDDSAIKQIASFLQMKNQSNAPRVSIIGPIKTNNGLHMVNLMFTLNTSPKKLIYGDPSGLPLKVDTLEILKKITQAADMQGQFEVLTRIATQQTPDQPDTCVAWGTKNAFDFIATGQIEEPSTVFEATKAIQPYLDKYSP